jgi:uncharacterized membrane protein
LDDRSNDIESLSRKLNILISKQDVLSREIEEIRSALDKYREEDAAIEVDAGSTEKKKPDLTESHIPEKDNQVHEPDFPEKQIQGKEEEALKTGPARKRAPEKVEQALKTDHEERQSLEKEESLQTSDISSPGRSETRPSVFTIPESVRSNLEDFIGTNLFNKIGILILIIGISIGTKFAIDRDLISPMVRLILGYALGGALLFFAYRLKQKYHNFSAVLISGSMAIIYFMTFAGIIYLKILGVNTAFTIMVIVTVFTVYQALRYDREVIAIIGLVGAYAIPFLIGDDPEGYIFLFYYMAIINAGILIISIKRYWKLLFYIAFIATWMIYLSWWANTDFADLRPFRYSIIFSGIFFLLFYASFLLNKVINKIDFSFEDVMLILSNALIFYGLSYVNFEIEVWRANLGMFTLINASIHILVWLIIYYWRGGDKKLLRLIAGLAIAFITITIPIQYDGYWVTILWFTEALVLLTAGRVLKAYFYEFAAYPIFILGLYSLMEDWKNAYAEFGTMDQEVVYNLFFNINFLEGLIIIILLVVANYICFNPRFPAMKNLDDTFKNLIGIYLGGALVFILYYTFRIEMAIGFNQMFVESGAPYVSGADESLAEAGNQDIRDFKIIWIHIYSMVFFSLITITNILKFRNEKLGQFNLIINGVTLFAFLVQGLLTLSALRESFIDPEFPDRFIPGIENILIRYLAIVVFAYMVAVNYWLIRQKFMKEDMKLYMNLFIALATLWILSSELFHWLDFAGYTSADKLGLSILWGVFSLILIIIGISNKLKYLRVGAIILFGITLLKLSIYDIRGMDSLSKTVVFISLGILLLIISFLYNKYRKIIF